MSATDERRARLEAERGRVAAQVDELRRTFDQIVAAAAFTSTDDEHDPEGATIGFERAQTAALLDRAEEQLREIDLAIERWDAGTYGRCETCGAEIAPERLDALPATRTCVTCVG